jgi:[calcium/calmodulin-dependent protein kinase] kinase
MSEDERGRKLQTTMSGKIEVKETSSVSRTFSEILNKKLINDYVIERKLGSGAFGSVKLCYKLGNKSELFAMKSIQLKSKKKKIPLGPPGKLHPGKLDNKAPEPNKEAAIMKKLDHPNVVRLYEIIEDQERNKLYLVMEYVPYGSCFPKGSKPLGESEALVYIRDVICGIEYCLRFFNCIR